MKKKHFNHICYSYKQSQSKNGKKNDFFSKVGQDLLHRKLQLMYKDELNWYILKLKSFGTQLLCISNSSELNRFKDFLRTQFIYSRELKLLLPSRGQIFRVVITWLDYPMEV